MAEIKKKLEILANVDKPVEEIKECIIAISIMHGANQLAILKEIELWLGETITEAEVQKKSIEKTRELKEEQEPS